MADKKDDLDVKPGPAADAKPAADVEGAQMGDKKVNWMLTLILSILFGSLGVDRFMMGKIGTGILKLITFGGFGIWWLIDLILIATKHKFDGIEWEVK